MHRDHGSIDARNSRAAEAEVAARSGGCSHVLQNCIARCLLRAISGLVCIKLAMRASSFAAPRPWSCSLKECLGQMLLNEEMCLNAQPA